MWISRTVCLFMIYSCLGWIYETTLCTVKDGRWENRGFFYGPVCPIYGTGAVGISAVMSLAGSSRVTLENWQIFAISVVGSAVLEYITSWALEKMFHAVWWDYSKLPFNLHGRISLFTSLGFGLGGLLVVYVIAPFTEEAVRHVAPLPTEFLSLCFLAVFMVDLTLTVTALLHFDQMVAHAEDTFNRRMEDLVQNTVQRTEQLVDNTRQRTEQFVDSTKQRTEQIRQGFAAGQRYMSSLNTGSLGRLAKSAVKRVRGIRYDNEDREQTVRRVISQIRKDAQEEKADSREDR